MTGSPSAAPALQAVGATLAYDREPVLRDLDLTIAVGGITTLVGANGSGKSTLLKAFGRLHSPSAGEIRLEGRALRGMAPRAVARRLAVLPQRPTTPSATSVRELVARGRHPHLGMLRPWGAGDAEAVAGALEATGLTELADRDVAALSGGQLQRAWIALVLAQDAPTMLLDEPTTFLDLTHQLEVLDLVRRANAERGTTVLMVLHDLGLAARYSDRLVVLAGGAILADGAPWDVLTPEVLEEAFGLSALVIPDPVCGTPLVIPHDRRHPSPIPAPTPGKASAE